MATPLHASDPPTAVGVLLLLTAAIEAAHGFRRATAASQRAAWIGSGITLAMAVVLISAPWLAAAGLVLFVGVSFAIDGVRHAAMAFREGPGQPGFTRNALAAAGNLVVVLLLLVFRGSAINWTVAIAAGIRILGTAFNIAAAPAFTGREADDTVIADLGLTDDARMAKVGTRMQVEERERVLLDVGWLAAFVGTLFAIHIGRMGLDLTTLGLVSPGVAVLGDLAVALVIAYALVVPLKLTVRKATRRLERRAWQWSLEFAREGRAARWGHLAVQWWLESRLRFAIRLRLARYSLPQALGRGLQIGVPFAAIIVATIPVFGMSWYFDTENWAASIWNSWAESRTDIWRAAMVKAVVRDGLAREDASGFEVHPAGVGDEPFSFLVIGDTGEGDASQHVLRDQLIKAADQEDVRFVVISSDVVYPTGAMRDYELRFWLPFKGVTKPVFAIPGNHDWYDALEAFVATFFEPRAARAAMRARIEVDNRLTGTTDETVERLIAEAARLRREYGVPTGYQQGPFFQLQTEAFALIAVDTGVLKQVDEEQLTWLRAALDRADGKVVLALLGHPPLAGGLDQTRDNEPFAAITRLLREHHVHVVMAGDTHDLEYYRQPVTDDGKPGAVHYFVNGGGGAYQSFGTALAWPAQPPTAVWAFYPTRSDVASKINQWTPLWKRPAWWWTKSFGAWPFSAEWLSAAFDYNVAPFFQSFIEVRVEPADGRLRLRPWGVHGRLRWSDLQMSKGLKPAEAASDALVEWVVDARAQ